MKVSTVTVLFAMFLNTVYGVRRVHRARRNAKNLPSGSNIQGRKGLAEMLAALFEGQKVSVGSSTFNTNGQKFCIYISYSY